MTTLVCFEFSSNLKANDGENELRKALQHFHHVYNGKIADLKIQKLGLD